MNKTLATSTKAAVIKRNHIPMNDHTDLVEAVVNNQKNQAAKLIKKGLKNSNYQIRLDSKKIRNELKYGYEPDLVLHEHELVIPKGSVNYKKVREIKKAFGSTKVVNRPGDYMIKVYLEQGPYVVTVGTVIDELDNGIGVFAEKKLEALGLVNYKLIFIVTAFSPIF